MLGGFLVAGALRGESFEHGGSLSVDKPTEGFKGIAWAVVVGGRCHDGAWEGRSKDGCKVARLRGGGELGIRAGRTRRGAWSTEFRFWNTG